MHINICQKIIQDKTNYNKSNSNGMG